MGMLGKREASVRMGGFREYWVLGFKEGKGDIRFFFFKRFEMLKEDVVNEKIF